MRTKLEPNKRSPKTNPIGAGTCNVSVNVPEGIKAQLQALADKSGLKLGAYLRAVMADAIRHSATAKSEVVLSRK